MNLRNLFNLDFKFTINKNKFHKLIRIIFKKTIN